MYCHLYIQAVPSINNAKNLFYNKEYLNFNKTVIGGIKSDPKVERGNVSFDVSFDDFIKFYWF